MEEKTEERGRGCMTTLCYIEKDDSYLMMHRTVKKNDVNKDKWIGVGGHAELGESPEECLLREVKEETGYTLTSWRFRGLVTFVTEAENSKTVEYMEYMCLYTADGFTGEPTACDEGELAWVKKEDVLHLNLWEGDKIFFRLLNEDEPFFSLKLRYVGECATGYNNIDIAAAKAHGVTVCNVAGYSTDAVAQHTFALILHHYSRVAQYDAAVRQGAWKQAKTFCIMPYPMQELAEKTLAVVGYGSIGKKVAAIGAAFGMRLCIATRTQPQNCPYPLVSLDEAFRQADILTLHTPLTEQTAGMVNARRLKPTALLVNTARGGLIVEADLAQALQKGVIAGAALDVLTEEPMGDTPLFGLENCTLTPHAAWTPLETRQRLLELAAENLRCWLAGTPQNGITAP